MTDPATDKIASDKTATDKAATNKISADVQIQLEDLVGYRAGAKGLGLPPSRNSSSMRSGAHMSRLKGRGMEYEQSRAYQFGDDIRHIDWRVTARAGKLFSKEFQEEKDRQLLFIVDLNPSMHFGTRNCFKSVLAARITSLLGWAATAHGDRVGGMVFNRNTITQIKPGNGKKSLLKLLDLICNTDAESSVTSQPDANAQTNIDINIHGGSEPITFHQVLQQAQSLLRPGSLVVMLSDFYQLDSNAETQINRLAQHCDPLAVVISDQLEQTAPPPGKYWISHQQQTAQINTHSKALRSAWQQQFKEHQLNLSAMLSGNGIPNIRMSTEQASSPDQLALALKHALGIRHG
ncbi:DUF58 domain-containing protein [Pelagibaculum spongiae]|uniref:DUF58 domain-containing protein n=1 Tax=Pelagibaculum spongiae TaxID=2080658 RepID=A0A2V1GVW4_9GAMM|nr:DUF58 domain-containing protein [Pelagibaculum spongiae]PVZ64306.1 hypothetical protein DC094_19775 [Pelagibaculum spongiae]